LSVAWKSRIQNRC